MTLDFSTDQNAEQASQARENQADNQYILYVSCDSTLTDLEDSALIAAGTEMIDLLET